MRKETLAPSKCISFERDSVPGNQTWLCRRLKQRISVPQSNELLNRIVPVDLDSNELSSNGSDWEQQQRIEREDEFMSDDDKRDCSNSNMYLIRKGLSTRKSNLVMPKAEAANLCTSLRKTRDVIKMTH